jgi:hypothetical protein
MVDEALPVVINRGGGAAPTIVDEALPVVINRGGGAAATTVAVSAPDYFHDSYRQAS